MYEEFDRRVPWVSWVLTALGSLMVFVAVVGGSDAIFSGEWSGENAKGSAVMLSVAVGLVWGTSAYRSRTNRQFREFRRRNLERAAVQAAALYGGVATVATLMSECRMTEDEAHEVLEGLFNRNVATRVIKEDGVPRYTFPGV